jgi:hypothetical protein
VDPRAGLDDMEKRTFLILPGLELRPFSRPARSQSVYRLRYPGSFWASTACYRDSMQVFKLNYRYTQCFASRNNIRNTKARNSSSCFYIDV